MNKNNYAIFLIIISVFFAHIMIASTKLAQLEVNVITAALFRFVFGLIIISPIIMAIIFFLVVTPIGLIMRLMNKDILNLKYNNNKTYWLLRNKINNKMKNQF